MSGSSKKACRIAVVAPGRSIDRSLAERAQCVAAAHLGDDVELMFHAQCFEQDGHFAGSDEVRLKALGEVANDPSFAAVWFARGGYGACRIAEAGIEAMGEVARSKAWLGYSDMGFVLAGLDRAGFRNVAHGPMVIDLERDGGERAFLRGLEWLAQDQTEPRDRPRRIVFNLTVLSNLLGTALEPDFSGRELWIEDVGEYMYSIDRSLFHVTSNPGVRRCAGVRLGRVSDTPVNDPDFGRTEEEVVRYWCERAGIAFLGRADVGHDVDNTVVPFG